MKKILFLFVVLLTLALGAGAQNVAINSTGASANSSAMLDVSSANSGILIPRIALTGTTSAAPVTSPATSLLVYNTATVSDVTPGYYYWTGTAWIKLYSGPTNAWNLTGNSGTSPATNFIGTIDAQDWVIKTTNIERARVLAGGNVLFNRTTALYATDLFEAQGSATFPDAINGYTDQGTGTGVYGENSAGAGIGVAGVNSTATGAGTGPGVYGQSYQTGAAGVWGAGSTYTRGVLGTTDNATYAGVQGQNANIDGDGVFAVNSAATGAGAGTGIYGVSYQTGAAGVWGTGSTYTRGVLGTTNNATYAGSQGQNAHIDGDGVVGINSAASGAGTGTGVFGQCAQSGGAGVYSVNTNAAGEGFIAFNSAASGADFGDAMYSYTAQSGGFGLFSINGNATGTAVVGGGNNVGTVSYLTTGSGGAFSGNTVGVYGFGSAVGNGNFGGYFTCTKAGNGMAYVGGWGNGTIGTNNVAYGIISNGTKSTIVWDMQEKPVAMFCTEAPEVLFQDFGKGKMVNGTAHIDLDPVFSKNIFVDGDRPLRVFIQLEGNCKGVYVTNKTISGFDVIELDSGTSDVDFTWTVVANRADDYHFGEKASFATERFSPAPISAKSVTKETRNINIVTKEKSYTVIDKKAATEMLLDKPIK